MWNTKKTDAFRYGRRLRIFSVEDLCLGSSRGLTLMNLRPLRPMVNSTVPLTRCEQSVVLADAYVEAGMVHGAALTLEDVACFGKLAAKNL